MSCSSEEEEEFYESLDRILSSSCSSTSASDDDADHHHRSHRSHCHRRTPTCPAASMYDVWISEPSSVEERRRNLLQRLGLIGDPALSRFRFTPCDDGDEKRGGDGDGGGCPPPSNSRQGEMGRSVSCDGLDRQQDRDRNSLSSVIPRSRSDGSVDPKPPPDGHTPPVHKGYPSPNKPPLGNSSSSGTNTGEEDFDRYDAAGIHVDGQCDRYCTIKNLDNGEQFVVKEVTEDGTWNKLREVGTGRQLTMEEFQTSVIGHSPIVHELMRRQNVQESGGKRDGQRPNGTGGAGSMGFGSKPKKRGSWLRSIKNAAGTVVHRERRSSDERDTSSEKGGRRSSSATDDSQDAHSHHGPERIKVRQYGKSWKELTGLYMNQEIQAHNGSIWSIKFSLDGRYLASAGEDCVIHVWQVLESEKEVELQMERVSMGAEDRNSSLFAQFGNRSPEPHSLSSTVDVSSSEKKRRAKVPNTRKSFSLDNVVMPESVFALSEKPICTFRGHLDDVLDLSWSKSEYLLSSSMDKTVRLWHMSSNSCLKTFSHSDYVTCIQFNPVDDNYFISGSLDAKVRIWSVPQRQVVDWNDLHEMVTAACYTPDGQGALVGSHKGSCRVYNTSDNKLHQKTQIDLKNKKKKSHHKKITGFQFAPGSSSEVLITSADSRIRVVDGVELVHKFKGFRNTNSQISASLTSDGKYVISASEDSHVYVWRYDADSRTSQSKGAVTVTQSYEHFHCQGVSVAVPWPGTSMSGMTRSHSNGHCGQDALFVANTQMPAEASGHERSILPPYDCIYSPQHQTFPNGNSNHLGDRVSATWPEEKLLTHNKRSTQSNGDYRNSKNMQVQSRPAWAVVFVTAGRGGEIKTFQNFGYPVRI